MEEVQVLSGGQSELVTLRLTQHHLVLVQIITPPSSHEIPPSDKRPSQAQPRSQWIAYPMIANCTFRPTPPTSGHSPSIRLRGRDFRFITLNFSDDRQARDAFESIKAMTCRLGSIEKLYAFSYKAPSHPVNEKAINGWEIYDAKAEWKRLGISEKGVDRGWRISKLNVDYAFSPTYPALLPVPSSISDNTLK